MATGGWIDLTIPLSPETPVWPGDPPVEREPVSSIADGDTANVTRLTLGSHAGTHMDAPRHFLDGGRTIDELPRDATVGPCLVIDTGEAEVIEPDDLLPHGLLQGERVLLRTRNSARAWHQGPFDGTFVHLSTAAATHLAEVGVRCVGIDHLSVAGFEKNERAVHEALLGAGVWIIEGLDLSAVPEGRYELVCLPLRLLGGDGAPCRAMVRPLDR